MTEELNSVPLFNRSSAHRPIESSLVSPSAQRVGDSQSTTSDGSILEVVERYNTEQLRLSFYRENGYALNSNILAEHGGLQSDKYCRHPSSFTGQSLLSTELLNNNYNFIRDEVNAEKQIDVYPDEASTSSSDFSEERSVSPSLREQVPMKDSLLCRLRNFFRFSKRSRKKVGSSRSVYEHSRRDYTFPKAHRQFTQFDKPLFSNFTFQPHLDVRSSANFSIIHSKRMTKCNPRKNRGYLHDSSSDTVTPLKRNPDISGKNNGKNGRRGSLSLFSDLEQRLKSSFGFHPFSWEAEEEEDKETTAPFIQVQDQKQINEANLLNLNSYQKGTQEGVVAKRYNELVVSFCHQKVHTAANQKFMTLIGARERCENEYLLRRISSLVKDKLKAKPSERMGLLRHIQNRVPFLFPSSLQTSLNEEDNRLIKRFFYSDNDKRSTNPLFRELHTLAPKNWLSDMVINSYCDLLVACSDRRRECNLQRVHQISTLNTVSNYDCSTIASLGTHFYVKVQNELCRLRSAVSGAHEGESLELPPLPSNSELLRWLRRRKHLLQPYTSSSKGSTGDTPINSCVRDILIPINVEGVHWTLAVLHKEEECTVGGGLGKWFYFDSLSRSDFADDYTHRVWLDKALSLVKTLDHVLRECRRHLIYSGISPTSQESEILIATPLPGNAVVNYNSPCISSLGYQNTFSSAADLERERKIYRKTLERVKRQFYSMWTLKRDRDTSTALKNPFNTKEFYHFANEQVNSILGEYELNKSTTAPTKGRLRHYAVDLFSNALRHCPQQQNGYDCGVYVCRAARCIYEGNYNFPPSYSSSEDDRTTILLELYKGELLKTLPSDSEPSKLS